MSDVIDLHSCDLTSLGSLKSVGGYLFSRIPSFHTWQGYMDAVSGEANEHQRGQLESYLTWAQSHAGDLPLLLAQGDFLFHWMEACCTHVLEECAL